MRVISGAYRGLRLSSFEGSAVRPTADRVKESLFNILYGEIAGARVLDLFCGSGSLGIECLSRGAEHVDFNDISPQSVKLLRSNLSRLRGETNYTVSTGDYASFLCSALRPYDIIFVDPPYADDCGIRALETIAARRLLTAGGVAVYERDRPFADVPRGLVKTDERRYGKTWLAFLRPGVEEDKK